MEKICFCGRFLNKKEIYKLKRSYHGTEIDIHTTVYKEAVVLKLIAQTDNMLRYETIMNVYESETNENTRLTINVEIMELTETEKRFKELETIIAKHTVVSNNSDKPA